jgi:hypothetical protein
VQLTSIDLRALKKFPLLTRELFQPFSNTELKNKLENVAPRETMYDKYEDATMLCIASKFLFRVPHILSIVKEKLTLAVGGEIS